MPAEKNRLRGVVPRSFCWSAWSWHSLYASFFALLVVPLLLRPGLDFDSAVYSLAAENFARNHHWWSMGVTEHVFNPFFEHPFLLLWIQGGIFQLFGSSDLSAKWLGIGSGALLIFFLQRIALHLVDRFLARIVMVLGVTCLPLIHLFPAFYLCIPMTSFCFGSLYYLLRSQHGRQETPRDIILSGLWMALAILSKGLAAFPAFFALLLVMTHGPYALSRPRYLLGWLSAGLLPFLAFCVLQETYGEYSFSRNYFFNCFFDRAFVPGVEKGPLLFYKVFFRRSWFYLILTALSFLFLRRSAFKRILWVSLVFGLSFVLGNSLLGFPFAHYYYPIFAALILPSGLWVYGLFRYQGRVTRAVGAFVGLCLFARYISTLPELSEPTPTSDYQILRPVMERLRGKGVAELVAVGHRKSVSVGVLPRHFPIFDANYEILSAWYWRLPTRTVTELSDLKEVAIIDRSQFDLVRGLRRHGLVFCADGTRYTLWVSPRLRTVCHGARDPFPAVAASDL